MNTLIRILTSCKLLERKQLTSHVKTFHSARTLFLFNIRLYDKKTRLDDLCCDLPAPTLQSEIKRGFYYGKFTSRHVGRRMLLVYRISV
ncbi:hypothetical protein ALT721_140019 [Alteromonas alvinellae]